MHAALVSLLLAAPYAWEEPGSRLDHRGQLALFVAPAFEQLAATGRGAAEPALLGELLVGIPVTDEGGLLIVGGRAGAGAPLGGERLRIVAPFVGYRGYAGGDAPWKTFFDAGVFLRVEPLVAGGLRVGAGVQYDVSENAGFFLAGGIGLSGGEGVQLGGDLVLGVQLRFGEPG